MSASEQELLEQTAPLPPDQRIGFALVGVGQLTLAEILPALEGSKRCQLAALVTGEPQEGVETARRYGLGTEHLYTYERFDEIINDDTVQAVYIALPNSLHREYTERAAKAGKHVLCEKPMATTTTDAEAMIRACEDANVKLMIAYRCQFEPHHIEMRRMAREESFGAVKLVEAVNGQNEEDAHAWRMKRDLAGGGPLPDVGIYCLNTIRFVLGEEPSEVFAQMHQPKDDPRFSEVEESISWTMRFPSGIIANCLSSYGHHEARRYRLYASDGWFGMDPAFSYQGLRLESGHTAQGGVKVREERNLGEVNQFALEFDHFAQAIQEDFTPFTPGEEGLQDMRIIEAIYRSAQDGRPVKLEVINEKDAFRGRDA
jgi:predicted dehydrogenase